MKTLLLIMTLLFSSLHAQTALLLHKGWQLIGSTAPIGDMQIFDPSHVEQVWRYSADRQQWEGYSPDPTLARKISAQGYRTIGSLESWHGFWIKSRDEWVLTLPDDQPTDENITLRKGWNLISLPVNSVVSPHIFDGHTVWKYAPREGWELFDPDGDETYPAITHITNADGIWVKSDKKETISTLTDAAKLHNFKNLETMEAYIKDMLLTHRRPWIGYYPLTGEPGIAYAEGGATGVSDSADTANAAPGSKAGNTSDTNIQEAGVDEADILKHDDTYIYYLSRADRESRIHINTFARIAQGLTKPIATIDPQAYTTDIYLTGERLILLARDLNDQIDKPLPPQKRMTARRFFTPDSIVEIYDVSDPLHATRTARFEIEGAITQSRLTGGKLYLITQFDPIIYTTYPKIYVDAPECREFFTPQPVMGIATAVGSDEPTQTTSPGPAPQAYQKYARCYQLRQDSDGRLFRNDYDHPKIIDAHLLPYYTKDKTDKTILISPETLYVSDKKDQQPVITTVSQIDIASEQLTKTASVMGYNDTVYASRQALYLVSTQYPSYYRYDRYRERSAIYRIALGDRMGYDAFGFVDGKPVNQFSLSEYDGYLRIATTSGNSWQNNTINTLYTLSPIDHTLLIQGVLSGLGETGERIRAVRFLGDKGYIVTFRQTDPFYTLDLSDPLHPKKAGELKVDGYSAYLHPIGEHLILGYGRDATPEGRLLGLKMELFDVSDLAHPQTLDSYTLAGGYTSSEIERNHKALAYRPDDNLFAFPYTAYNGPGIQNMHNLLGIFQVENDRITRYLPPLQAATNTTYLRRGLLFDQSGETYIAFISDGTISYTTLSRLTKETR